MNIIDAVKALESGKVIHCPNSFETFKTQDSDLGTQVLATRKLESGKDEQQVMYLTRFGQLYKNCVFGLGKFDEPKAKPTDVKADK